MCKGTTCGTCSKSTWFGCGAHVPSVMDSVKEEDRCTCSPKVEKEGKEYPPMGSPFGGIWSALGLGGKKKETKDEL